MPSNRVAGCAACLFLLLAPLSASADDHLHVLTGTLGKSSIVVELDLADPGDVSGRYFYEKYHTDLSLTGKLKGNDLTLTEGESVDEDASLPTLQLHKAADASWSGEWSDHKGKSFKVQLSEQRVAAPDAAAEPGFQDIFAQSTYDYLRVKQLTLKPGKKESFMGHALQWWAEPQTGLMMFEVTDGYTPEQAARINPQLRSRLWHEVVSYHECLLGASRHGGEFVQTVTPQMLTPDIVSLNVSTSYDCGGAHPDGGDSPLNLDVNTGNELTLEDVLWLGKGKPFHYERDEKNGVSFDVYSDYSSTLLAPWLVAQLTAAYPEEMKAPASEDDCDYSDESVWTFPSWYLTPKGILFNAYFARAMRACDSPEWAVIPYSVIKEHPGGVKVVLPE